MFYFVIFCNVLITNGCGAVFERQGPEVRTEEREARRQTHEVRSEGPSGEAASPSSHPDQLIAGLSGLLRQLASPSPLYPDHKLPEDSSIASAMYLVPRRGQAPLPQ